MTRSWGPASTRSRGLAATRCPEALDPSPRSGQHAQPGLASTAAITLGASILGAGVNFVLAVVVGRAYGAAETGLFFAVVGVFLVLANVLKLGADTGLTRYGARLLALGRQGELPVLSRAALLPIFALSVPVAAALWWLGGLQGLEGTVGGLIDGAHGAAAGDLLRHLAPFAPLLALTTVLTAGTRGLGHVLPYALLQNVALPVTRLAGVVVAAWLGLGIAGAVGAWAAGLPLVAVAAALAYRRAVRRAVGGGSEGGSGGEGGGRDGYAPPSGVRALRREFWGFSLPRAVAALVEIVLEWLDVLLVALLAGEVAAGLYAVATRLVKVTMIIDNALRVSISTRISAWLATGRIDRVQALYEVATRAMVALIWPFLLVLAVFAEAAAGLFGPDFAGAVPVLRVMCVGVALFAAAGSLQTILLLGGLSRRQLANKSVALVACTAANLVLTPRWGAVGGALSWVFTVLIDTALVAWAVHRRMGVQVSTRAAATMGPLVLACVGVPALATRWWLGPSIAAAALAGLLGMAVLALVVRRGQRLEVITRRLRETT